MKFLANSSYGYQIMNRSRHTVTKYLSDKKLYASIISKLFKRLVKYSVHEVELAKAQIEHKKPIIVRFFILQCAKLRKLELHYNVFTKLCDVNKFEELEMDTDSLYLGLAEKELEHCIRPQMRTEWQRFRSNDCVDSFAAHALANVFPRTCCVKHKQHDKSEHGFSREEFRCSEISCLCSRSYCCYDVTSNKPEISGERLNKHVLEQNSDWPLEKYRRGLNEKTNITLNNRGFRTNNHSFANYEENRKSMSYFYPKRIIGMKAFTLNRFICEIFIHFSLYIVVCLSNFVHVKYFFKILIQSFYKALCNISICNSEKSDWQPILWVIFPFLAGFSFFRLSIYDIS